MASKAAYQNGLPPEGGDHKFHSSSGSSPGETWRPAGNRLDWSCSPPALIQDGRRFPLPPGLPKEVYEDICCTPFLDLDSPMTAYEWFKFVLYLPFLVVRCLLVAAILPCVLGAVHVCVADHPYNEPLSGAKAAFLRPFLRFWAKVLMVVGLNFYHSVKGREHLAEAHKARALLVINHASYLDALVMGEAFLPCGLAKSAVTNIPAVGTLAKALQFLLVERRDTDDAKVQNSHRGSVTALIHERAQDPRFPLFLIGPEGTTKTRNVVLPFSTGGFVHGHPVVPVLLRYRARHFNVGWGSITNPIWHFLRVQAQFINHLQVEVLPVYYPSPEEASSPRLYADNVRKLMAGALGAELCDHGLAAHTRLKKNRIAVDWTGRHIVQEPLKTRSSSKKQA